MRDKDKYTCIVLYMHKVISDLLCLLYMQVFINKFQIAS